MSDIFLLIKIKENYLLLKLLSGIIY